MRAQVLRLFWVATLVFAAGLGYLWARVTVTAVSRALWVTESVPRGATGTAVAKRPPDALSDYRIIEDRNLFNARPTPPPQAPVVVVPPPPPIQPPVAPPPPPPPPEPPLDLKLVGTAVIGAGNSYAIVITGSDTRVVREREEIIPGAMLTEVRNDKILVRWRERTEEFNLYETRSLSAAPTGPRSRSRMAPQAPAGGDSPSSTPPVAGQPAGGETVRRLSDDRWSVDNKEVAQLRDNMSSMMTQVRVVPNFGEGGQPDGFKVFAIRPGSLFAKIGLQNGDVIRKINGIEMQGPEQAMEAYARLREETTISIDLLRQNQNRTLTYEIH